MLKRWQRKSICRKWRQFQLHYTKSKPLQIPHRSVRPFASLLFPPTPPPLSLLPLQPLTNRRLKNQNCWYFVDWWTNNLSRNWSAARRREKQLVEEWNRVVWVSSFGMAVKWVLAVFFNYYLQQRRKLKGKNEREARNPATSYSMQKSDGWKRNQMRNQLRLTGEMTWQW